MSTHVQKYNVPVIKKFQPDDSYNFQPTPKPTGTYPFHLDLQAIQPITDDQKMVFHMLGDTGSIYHSDFLRHVAGEMSKQYELAETSGDRPQFLYHLGDVVYNHGEAKEYKRQFFEPFENYPSSIFAIAGNHDSDVNHASKVPYKSLDAFVNVFCDTAPRTVAFSGNAKRKSMIQPNLFWSLQSPLAVIIGLHSNVPKFGIITSEQRTWLVEELKSANSQRPGKAIILCLHHAPYSADINHGSSLAMIALLESVFEETGIRPDIVFSGHVHNYQRFTKQYEDGKQVPFIVAGAGGYDGLHAIALTNDKNFETGHPLFEGVKLDNYCEDQHGFLKISIEKTISGLTLKGEYYTTSFGPESAQTSSVWDRFVVHI
ncbi:metallophosphoesterase [Dyadobacter sp. NIV53]|uniref:metallophosphoesterase family protein n=1 Tax=Dyadobacter sp. NIV53 TaxID=2861765 RepID=UPI001C8705E4|nr:metallophosphoesterase [Dyadobacter sp. NIV53]